MSQSLTERERQEFRERGFFVRPALLQERELAELRAEVEVIHARVRAAAAAGAVSGSERIDGRLYQRVLGSLVKWEWDESLEAIRSMEPVHCLSPLVDRWLDDERWCRPAADLLGTASVSLFTDKLNFKRPGGSPFPWHQDAPYWAFDCAHVERLASLQLYLDDATEDNGCLWLVPGSHRFGHLPGLQDRGVLGRLYTDLRPIEGEGLEPLPITAPAGSAVFFDAYLVHGSRGNRSEQSRRALVLTYQPPGLPLWRTQTVRAPVAN